MTRELDGPDQPSNGGEPTIIAIGASAGGIRALQTLFEQMPTQTGAAFVVIVHLAPERRSELPAVLRARTQMPVVQVNGRVKLEADHIYVIPPEEYHELMRENPEEAKALLGDLLISVTTSFRDGEVFETLQREVLPRLFDNRSSAEPRRVWVSGRATGEDEHTGATAEQQASDETVRQLIQELELTRSRLRTVRGESDAANEELRAANEELQSINEEYRSTSDELETSKEELQSINEELQAVNSELRLQLQAISRAHSDLQNLMAATDFGTLFLDSGLRIKRFTEQVTELFSITPSDEGRPITDFSHKLEYEGLIRDARAVLAELVPIRREVRSRDQHWYDMRLRPYRTVDDKIDGVVITFVDITERQKVEAALRASERDLLQQKRLVDLSRDPIFVWDFDGGILEWNRGSEELYGYGRAEVLGKTKHDLLRTVVPGSSFAQVRDALLHDGSWTGEMVQRARDGRTLTVESHLELETVAGRRLVLESTRDIGERKQWDKRQQLLLRELTHRVKNTLAVVQSIARQTLRNSPSPADFVASFEGRLSALANAHNLLVQSEWTGASFEALARTQLGPYLEGNDGRVTISGPPFSLPADTAMPFALVLHELATNAAKYGALSRPGGTVNVSWTLGQHDKGRELVVAWQEMRDAAPTEFKRTGLGTALIDQAIPGAIVTRELGPNSYTCRITLGWSETPLDGELG